MGNEEGNERDMIEEKKKVMENITKSVSEFNTK